MAGDQSPEGRGLSVEMQMRPEGEMLGWIILVAKRTEGGVKG